ncbi:MAG TPA: DUF2933 domain-containing protein [Gammaproteobacteria bacterium]|nr:DUF2933 domain-containing protein [Gammaproteobacteria bacterium]
MSDESSKQKYFWKAASTISVLIIIAVFGYYLFSEHSEHAEGFLARFPWWILILLLCPLMHLMHGHGGHHHEKKNNSSSEKKD